MCTIPKDVVGEWQQEEPLKHRELLYQNKEPDDK